MDGAHNRYSGGGKESMKWLAKVTQSLNRNTGYLSLVVIILVGLAILSYQKDARRLLSNTNSTVQRLEDIVEKLDKGQKDTNQNTQEIKVAVFCLLSQHDPQNFSARVKDIDCATALEGFSSEGSTEDSASLAPSGGANDSTKPGHPTLPPSPPGFDIVDFIREKLNNLSNLF